MTDRAIRKFILFFIFLTLMLFVLIQLNTIGLLDDIGNADNLILKIKQLGLIGPVAIICLISIAVVITPIPSAPVALVSGALYGHTFGTIYVVTGALIGALAAFMISRTFGYEYVDKKFHHKMPVKIVGSQNTLMLIVFVTRLAPFISFDVISYAAGLTRLTYTRFVIATLLGIIPISFLLAHMGSEVKSGEMESILIALLLLGLLIIIPIIINKLRDVSNEGK